jgi:hypothetical protein
MLINTLLSGCANNIQPVTQYPTIKPTVTVSPIPSFITTVQSEQDNLTIYQAVTMEVLLSKDSYFQTTKNPIIFIIRYTNDAAGNPQLLHSKTECISENFQDSITSKLSDLDFKVFWIDNNEQAIANPETGRVKDNGMIVTLGNINFENANKALVPASYYLAPLGAGGRTYIVEKVDGVWTVTGFTGSVWMS